MPAKETYIPKEGDCLSSLAVAKNFDAETVFKDQPGPIQKSLTSPNHLIPGKPILLPKDERSFGGRAASTLHNFVTPTAKVKLRVLLTDIYDKPLEGEYKFGHQEVLWHYTGKAAIPANGIIEKEVPADTMDAELTVYPKANAKPPTPAPAAAPAPDAYPPPFRAADFHEDAPSSHASAAAPAPIVWTLKVGCVPSHTEEAGMRARLANLGFDESKGLDALIPQFRAWYGTEKVPASLPLPYSQLTFEKRIQAQNDLRDIHDKVTAKSRPAHLDK